MNLDQLSIDANARFSLKMIQATARAMLKLIAQSPALAERRALRGVLLLRLRRGKPAASLLSGRFTRRISLSSSLRYGARIAVPRIVEIWKHFGIRQTMFVPGWCIETYPDAIELLLEGGHEIAHHGWLHERPNQLSRDDEEAVLKKGIAAIIDPPPASRRPAIAVPPAPSPSTRSTS